MFTLYLLVFFISVALSREAPTSAYCLASDTKCFPAPTKLERFNASVNGRLIKTEPYGTACYLDSYNAEACKELAEKKHSPDFRRDLAAGLMYSNTEQYDRIGCPVPDLPKDGSAPPPVSAKCELGAISAYLVKATCADHVAKAVKFAADHKLRLRIKNTGHDYLGRSSAPGAFTIWTRYMTDMALIEDFRMACDYETRRVISAGPGVTVEELYAFAGHNGVNVVGGFCPTVGATGGYVLGGGTGPLGHIFGMAVDNVVQFEVVTADGRVKTANKCENTDLFWALRGGGGAFAAVTRVFYLAQEPFEAVTTMATSIGCSNQAAYKELVRRMVDTQVPARDDGHMAIWLATKKTLSVTLLSMRSFFRQPLSSAASMVNTWKSPLSVPGCQVNTKTAHFTGKSSFYDAYSKGFLPVLKAEAPVGVNIFDQSSLISNDMINDKDQRCKIVDFITSLPPDAPFLWQNAVGDATRKVAPDATAVHPAWRKAFAFMDIPIFGPWSGVTQGQTDLTTAILRNATDVFGPATYYNEASGFEDDWQKAFWGDNYARLLKIKKDVDPKGVFNCRLCVGSEMGR